MSNYTYSPEEIEKLRSNPNVKKVTAKQIVFTETFKLEAVRLYHEGQTRREILRNAGFDVEKMGKNKIANTLGNWLTKEKKGKPIISEKKGRKKRFLIPLKNKLNNKGLRYKCLSKKMTSYAKYKGWNDVTSLKNPRQSKKRNNLPY